MENDNYRYSVSTLKAISINYQRLYKDFPLGGKIGNLWSVAELKADFDMALRRIGRGQWIGLESAEFRDYQQFGRLQKIIIADIIGIRHYELIRLGFTHISQLRGYGYWLMKYYLNGGDYAP